MTCPSVDADKFIVATVIDDDAIRIVDGGEDAAVCRDCI